MWCLACKNEGAYWARTFDGKRVLICPGCGAIYNFEEVIDFLVEALKGLVSEATRNDLKMVSKKTRGKKTTEAKKG